VSFIEVEDKQSELDDEKVFVGVHDISSGAKLVSVIWERTDWVWVDASSGKK